MRLRANPNPDTQAMNKSSKKLPGLSPRDGAKKGEVAAAPARG